MKMRRGNHISFLNSYTAHRHRKQRASLIDNSIPEAELELASSLSQAFAADMRLHTIQIVSNES